MSAAIAAVLDEEDDDNSSYAAFPSLLTIAASSSVSSATKKPVTVFDSDSFTILVDNGASRCMTNNIKHFVGTTRPISRKVTGLGAGLVTLEGTVRRLWEDDQGMVHSMDIPNTLYCAELTFCLLSPQHLATERQDNSPVARGTWLATYADAMVLQWKQRQYQRTIPLSSTNAFVGIMQSAPGYRKSTTFLNLCALSLPSMPMCFPAPLFHEEPVHPTGNADPELETTEEYNWVLQPPPIRQNPLRFDFDPDRPGEPPSLNTTIESSTLSPIEARVESIQSLLESAKHELLTLHHRLGHMPFNHIRRMIQIRQANSRLLKCPIPVCSACLFAKAVKRAWRSKSEPATLKIATRPGEIVSIDQLESSTPGLIAHSKGIPTTKRFTCATIFVDHFSRLAYIHLQESTGALETLAAKQAFELFADGHQVRIYHYHGDNGRFADNAFRASCNKSGQLLSFCGVNAHFQNGIAESKIRDLQDRARTMIVHAKHRWPDAITSNLWPYALRLANESSRCIPLRDGKNPLQLFTGRDFQVAIHQNLHPFGCPMYVLKSAPASGKKGSKWGERARCGIYLGLSPEHASSVCLVLSLTTGLVSAQFHVCADEHFETVGSSFNGVSPQSHAYQSHWQEKHGFGINGRNYTRKPQHWTPRAPPQPLPRFQARQTMPSQRMTKSKRQVLAPDHHINRQPPRTATTVPQSTGSPVDSDDSDSDDEPPPFVPHVTYRAPDIAPVAAPQPMLIPPAVAIVTPGPAPTVHARPQRTKRPPRRLIASAATLPPVRLLRTSFPSTGQYEAYNAALDACTFPQHHPTDDEDEDMPDLPPRLPAIVDQNSPLHDLGEFVLQDNLQDPIAFAASADPDTMYLYEARRQPDWPQFQLAMQEEVRAHEDQRHWKLIRRAAVPHGVCVLPSVWSMKRKRRIATREIYKWKARLTVHGGNKSTE